MIHTEELADGDEFDISVWIESQCDLCGKKERHTAPTEVAEGIIRESWLKRDAARRTRQHQASEDKRRKTNPSIREIAEAWILAASQQTITDNEPSEFDRLEADAFPPPATSERLPDIANIRASDAAGDFQKLFFDKRHSALVNEFKLQMAKASTDRNVRSGAIALYWRLSTYIPGYWESDCRWSKSVHDWVDVPFAYFDSCDKEENRNLRQRYSSYLADLVRTVDPKAATTWAEARWEIRNACAAEEWNLVEQIFRHASDVHLKAEGELLALELHVTYLSVCGHELRRWLDSSLVTRSRLCPYSEDVNMNGYGWTPAIVDARSDTDALCFVYSTFAGIGPKDLSDWQRKRLKRLVQRFHLVREGLGDIASFYESLLAQLLESANQLRAAADHYRQLSAQHCPFRQLSPGGVGYRFATHASSLFLRVKDCKQSEVVLNEFLRLNPTNRKAAKELALLQLKKNKRQEAGETITALGSATAQTVDDGALLLLIEHTVSQKAREKAAAEARQWPRYKQLSDLSQKEWVRAKEMLSETSEQMRVATVFLGSAVERELRSLFIEFMSQKRQSKDRQNGESEESAYDQEHQLTIGRMWGDLAKARTGRYQRLADFVIKRAPGLLTVGSLTDLGALKVYRNSAAHGDPMPFAAEDANKIEMLARRIIESLFEGREA